MATGQLCWNSLVDIASSSTLPSLYFLSGPCDGCKAR